MLLSEVVATSAEVAATRSRLTKTRSVAATLRRSASDESRVVAAYLAGRLPQRRIGVGYRSLSALPQPAEAATLTVADVDATMRALEIEAGTGSSARRSELVRALFARATAQEQTFLRALMTEGVRQGAMDGVLIAAIAAAAELDEAAVRRAAMLTGDLASVAHVALTEGLTGLQRAHLVPGRPVQPMLAGSAPDVPAALAAMGEGTEVAVERKLDGIRLQAHKVGPQVRLFTRSLDDITDRLPEVVELVATLGCDTVVLDAEAIALRSDGRPEPFQVTGARTASRGEPGALRAKTPVSTFVFDVLHLDGDDLLDAPYAHRSARLAALVPASSIAPSVRTADPGVAQQFFEAQVDAGHEGVIVKDLALPYAAGRRGAGWIKVKPRHTLDLVVLAVEWGSGRRRGLLSNIHLGARTPDGGFVMLGKTFKGMTDEMLAWQTERFLALETHRDRHVVYLRPEQVVEIAFDGVQRSTRYPGGVALRFARVLRYRDDKPVDEIDSLATVVALGG